MAFRNYMEEGVVEELPGVLERLKDACKREKCRQDMVTYALNRLPPKYVATDLGNVYTKLNQMKAQARADIQDPILEKFLGALNTGGFLIQGNVESIFGPIREKFIEWDRKCRVYLKK